MEKRSRILDSTAVIFALSMLAYIVAYCFEVGYLRWFDINYQSAHVQTESFVISFIIIVPVALFLQFFINVLRGIKEAVLQSKTIKKKWWGRPLNSILSIELWFMLLYAAAFSVILSLPWWGFACFLGGFYLAAELGNRRKVIPRPSSNLVSKSVDFYVEAFIMLSFLTIVASIALGGVYARQRVLFKSTTIDGARYIVIREYNNLFILKGVGPHNRLNANIKFVPVGDLNELTFQQVKIQHPK